MFLAEILNNSNNNNVLIYGWVCSVHHHGYNKTIFLYTTNMPLFKSETSLICW